MEIIVALLIEWLALNTEVDMYSFPHVEVVPHSQIIEMSGVHAQGLYNWEEKKVFISSRVDLSTIQGVSVILHELVHHHQNVTGLLASYECTNQSEVMAYEIQKQFLTSMNASLMLEHDPAHIALASKCFASK